MPMTIDERGRELSCTELGIKLGTQGLVVEAHATTLAIERLDFVGY
jgi:hypothetical protein